VKTLKKIISLVLALILVVSTVAFAQSSEMEDILRSVKERIPSTEEYDRLDSRTTVDRSGRTSYRFNWYKETSEDYGELSVAVSQSGIITSYNKYHEGKRSEATPSINRKTYADVLPVAVEFAKKINPGIFNSLEIAPETDYESLYPHSYSYGVQRMENGIPVQGDNGYIIVSEDGTEVESFYLVYTEGLEFESESPETLISQAQAQEAFSKELGMKLYYTMKYEGKERKIVLVYSPDKEYNQYISAQDGKVIEKIEPVFSSPSYNLKAEETVSDSMAGGSASENFTEAEKAELENIANLLTKEEATELALKNPVIKLSDKYIPEYYNLTKDYYQPDRYYWEINFDGEDVYANVCVDATDGRIVSFRKDRNYGNVIEIPPDVAEENANKAFEALAPQYYSKDNKGPYVANPSNDGLSFTWTRHENGIPYDGSNVIIEVDKITGDVVYYSLRHVYLDFPSPEGIIDEQTAAKKLFEQVDYSLVYIKTCSGEDLKAYDKAEAVYDFSSGSLVVKANDGSLFYDYGVEGSKLDTYTDIAGHFSENAAETLRKYGVGFEGGKFKPDEVITQKDMVALLTAIFYRGGAIILGDSFNYDSIYSKAEYNGILLEEEASPDSPVTRETAAVMIIRAMGLSEAASLEGIYKCPFADVTEKQGYVSILYAMNIFRGDENGNFNPQNTITRGEVAVALLNYLSK